MAEAEIQYVSNENGEPTAVIVPISVWRDIESERETAHLLKSETMKRRLLEAKERQQGISLDEAGVSPEFLSPPSPGSAPVVGWGVASPAD
jgi:hypothetical protein